MAEPEVPSDNGVDIPAPHREDVEEHISPPQAQLEPEAEQPAVPEQEVQDRIPDVSLNGADVAQPRRDEVQRDHPLSPSPGESQQVSKMYFIMIRSN